MRVLTDAQWGRISPSMPTSEGKRGKRLGDHRPLVEGIIYRYRTGIAWRDVATDPPRRYTGGARRERPGTASDHPSRVAGRQGVLLPRDQGV